ncbi:MAG: alanine--tRNA ligase [Candidatus Dojkabacteria bacterium]
MKVYSYKEIRDRYIEFFKERGHAEIPNSPLIPENDPTVLFVNAGMLPLVPFLKGEKHPKGNRLVNSQRCLRTGDIDLVGNTTHYTTIEMLGNWSLNDYFKKEALNFTVEFFVEELGFDIQRIYATVFEGDREISKDETSIGIWKDIFKRYGIKADVGKEKRIQTLGREDNWWGLESGGPCGPDSEIFYKNNNGELIEIGNNVFMEYLLEDNKYKPLGRHNVDFGGGLERITAIVQNVDSFYETDIFRPVLQKIKDKSKRNNIKSQRIIADHIKASALVVMDGIKPGSTQQSYILRRLIRRAVRHGKLLDISKPFTRDISKVVIEQFTQIYPDLKTKKEEILNTIEEEELRFNKTIESGLKELEKKLENRKLIDGKEAFHLYETYGLPIEVTEEILKEKNSSIENKEDFYKAQKEHQEKSRTSSKGMFQGGLSDTSEMSTKYHTATHLLLATLRKVLGNHIYQKGSNITPKRLRLDFPSEKKLTEQEVNEVERIVNEIIGSGYEISYEEKPKEQALEIIRKHSGIASFTEKYGDILKIYYIGPKDNPVSVEICNGPHVQNTKDLGVFKIIKQENVGAGIKRIKAILE